MYTENNLNATPQHPPCVQLRGQDEGGHRQQRGVDWYFSGDCEDIDSVVPLFGFLSSWFVSDSVIIHFDSRSPAQCESIW